VKRLVFIHADGLHQILGATKGELPEAIHADDGSPIEMLPGRNVAFASLVRVTTRAAFYKEPMTPRSYGSFDARQQ
jgi:hypothetical protein